MRARIAICVWMLLAPFSAHSAQTLIVEVPAGQTIEVGRKDDGTRIRIDGRLDEAIWAELPAYDEFVTIDPDTLADVRHPTHVRLTYSADGLYVGVSMKQPPETLIKRLSGRDQRSINRDTINITLDTSGTGRYGYWFGLALGDSIMDGTVLPERQFTSDWDGAWRGATVETDDGWSAEFLIPWGTVSMPAAGEKRRIGLYMSRKVAYIDERWGWPALPASVPKFMSALQSIEVEGINPRQQYSVFPFVALGYDRIDGAFENKIGADFFWRPSSNFQLLATVNPDFGNVESDDVVINLSATETFFPEKRLFFLEGQEVFFASPRADTRGTGVGNRGSPTTLINTRRIGGKPREVTLPAGARLSKREEFQPVELLGAAKATGQIGRVRYGVLAAMEDDVVVEATLNGTPLPIQQSGSDYGVVRVVHESSDGGDYRAFGALATAALHPDGDALTAGIDGHYLSGDGKLKLDTQLITSDLDGSQRGYGGFFDVEYTFRQGVAQRVGIEYWDEHIELNDLGFLARNDSLRLRAAHVRTSSDLSFARNNQFDLRGFLQRNADGLFTGGGIFLSDRLVLNDLSSIVARLNFTAGAYDDLNSFGNGTYRIEEKPSISLDWSSATTGKISYGFGFGLGAEDVGGEYASASANFTWIPSDRLNLNLRVGYRHRRGWLLHQEERNMTTFNAELWTPSISADYFLTAKQQLRASLQWVGVQARERDFYLVPATPGDLIEVDKPAGPSDSFGVSQLSFQVRYRWEIAPLSDLFIVYTRVADAGMPLGTRNFADVFQHGWENPLGDVFVVKLRYRIGS